MKSFPDFTQTYGAMVIIWREKFTSLKKFFVSSKGVCAEVKTERKWRSACEPDVQDVAQGHNWNINIKSFENEI